MGRVILYSLRLTVQALRYIVPVAVRAFGHTVKLILLAISSLWVGVPSATERVAQLYTHNALFVWNIPSRWAPHIYLTVRVIATLTIIAGWILTAYITIWLLERII